MAELRILKNSVSALALARRHSIAYALADGNLLIRPHAPVPTLEELLQIVKRFRSPPRPAQPSLSFLLSGFAGRGLHEPSRVALELLLSNCVSARSLRQCRCVHGHILIRWSLLRREKDRDAFELCDQMWESDAALWNALVSAYLYLGDVESATKVFDHQEELLRLGMK